MALFGFANRINGKSHGRSGRARRDNKDWTEVAAAYSSHLELAPEDFAIWVQLSHAREESGNLEGAREA